jgi:soluble lytic murein transglycosylase-like protein
MKKFFIFLSIFLFVCFSSCSTFNQVENLNYKEYIILKDNFKWLTRDRFKIIKEESNNKNVSPALICSIIKYETNGNSKAISKAGAKGLMQLMPCHLKKNEDKNTFFDEKINISRGTAVLGDYRNRAKYDIRKTLKNYNSGPNSKYYNEKYINKVSTTYFSVIKKLGQKSEFI